MLALKSEGRVPRNDRKRRDFRQVGDDVLTDAVAEILLSRIIAHVREWQHANGQLADWAGRTRRGGASVLPGRSGQFGNGGQDLVARRQVSIAIPVMEVGKLDAIKRHRHRAACKLELN